MEREASSFDPRTWVQPAAAGANEPEPDSFNPRTWVQPVAPQTSPPESEASSAPADAGRRAMWLGATLGGLVLLGSGGLLMRWSDPGAQPALGPEPAAAAAASAVSNPAKPPKPSETRIFEAADLDQLITNLEAMGIEPGMAAQAAREVIAALGTIEPMTITAELTRTDGRTMIAALGAEIANGAVVRVELDGSGNFVRQSVIETAQMRMREVSGTYRHETFYDSAVDAGMPNGLVGDFTSAFAYDVDWAQIDAGDRFRAVWEERVSAGGREVEPPRLILVEFATKGEKHAFFAYTPTSENSPRWFDARGQSNARSLMRTPIDGARITSKFGPRRHPIYFYNRPHNGVDFAAPVNTPIYAAGKGTILFAAYNGGPKSGYGNLIKLDHGDGVVTHYAHLNGFAPGIAPGASVTQGQVIGYLGSTGGSTGPHLHFEINVNGQYVDPLSFENTNTAAEALTGEELRMYLAQREATLAEIAQGRKASSRTPEASARLSAAAPRVQP